MNLLQGVVVAILTLSLLAPTRSAEAQQAGKVWLIGYLDRGSRDHNRRYFEAFRGGLNDLGWREGQNVAIEARFAEGKTDQLPRASPISAATSPDGATWASTCARSTWSSSRKRSHTPLASASSGTRRIRCTAPR